MKFIQAAATAAIFAGAVVAAPTSSNTTQESQLETLKRLSKLLNKGIVTPFKSAPGPSEVSPAGDVTYSTNWGGAIIDGTGITQVQATFTVPSVSLPSGDDSSDDYYGCAWVGIDGSDSCSAGLWQAGAYWLYSGGSWSYFPFFEWYPGGVNAANMDISPGDTISVSVVATTTTSGIYTFTNQNSGQTVSGSLSNQPQLCQETVEWIVEDNNSDTAVMPDFGSVVFNGAQYTANGNIYGVSGADISVVYDNNQAYTSCSVTGANQVSCSYQ